MTVFGWILVAVYGFLAYLAWSERKTTEMPNNNAVVLVLMVATVVGTLTIGTGDGLL